MAGPLIRSHASRHGVLLHIPEYSRTFLVTRVPSLTLTPAAQSLSNIFLPASHPTTPRPDLLASTLLRFVPHPSLVTEANITYATRQANLVLVGAIIIGSIRRVLQGAARALRATPASRNRVASLVLLVLAQLMVCVFRAIDSQLMTVAGYISPLDARAAPHVVPPSCGRRRSRDIRGVTCV